MSRAQATAEEYVIDGRRLEALRIAARNPAPPALVMLHEGLNVLKEEETTDRFGG
jgi:hypothetical protein